jgi:hypothetical protein
VNGELISKQGGVMGEFFTCIREVSLSNFGRVTAVW